MIQTYRYERFPPVKPAKIRRRSQDASLFPHIHIASVPSCTPLRRDRPRLEGNHQLDFAAVTPASTGSDGIRKQAQAPWALEYVPAKQTWHDVAPVPEPIRRKVPTSLASVAISCARPLQIYTLLQISARYHVLGRALTHHSGMACGMQSFQ